MSRRPVITDLESSVFAGHSRAACRNRTDDLFITSDLGDVFCRRSTSADVPLTCEYSDLLSAGVGQNRMRLAPRSAPLDLVSLANDGYFASGLT
jgi:hypothetical protein